MQITCERCDSWFDPHREPPALGANPWRCEHCGKEHDPIDYENQDPQPTPTTTESDGTGGGSGNVTIEIHVDGDGDGVNVG